MASVDWLDLLGWTEDQVQDLRVTGYTYLREGHYDRAQIFFEALVSLHPESLYDLQTLGALYVQLGDYRTAVEMLDRALAIDPGDENAKLNKGKALFQLGMRTDALTLTTQLRRSKDPRIKSLADALVLAYR